LKFKQNHGSDIKKIFPGLYYLIENQYPFNYFLQKPGDLVQIVCFDMNLIDYYHEQLTCMKDFPANFVI